MTAGKSCPPLNGTGVSRPEIPAFNSLAVRSLVTLFDPQEKVFLRSIAREPRGFHREAVSKKRTCIALLGLQRLAESRTELPFDLVEVHGAVLKDPIWVKSIGDLGLLIWCTSLCRPEHLKRVLNEFDFGKALERYPDAQEARTRGIAWFLAGISHAQSVGHEDLPDLTDLAVDAYHLLIDNQSDNGLFGHAAQSSFLRRSFCSRFGSFGDQIHAIYALTAFARSFQIEEPLASALNCGNAVRALQGEMGQWWSVYDRQTCRVANDYPVISLHQDGTAPLSLIALGEATGQSFDEAVFRGLSWITGANELGEDIRNTERTLIWDSVEPSSKPLRYWGTLLNTLKIPHKTNTKNLRVRYEARPDHFGWLLYAFGGLGVAPNSGEELAKVREASPGLGA